MHHTGSTHRVLAIAAALATALLLVACGSDDDMVAPPPAVDLSGTWPEFWVLDDSGGYIVPEEFPPPSIALAADSLGFSGATCYLDESGARVLAELRLTLVGPEIVGGEIVKSRWFEDPLPDDCTTEPSDETPLRLTITGAFIWDDLVRVQGAWITGTGPGLTEGEWLLETSP